jgi:hypothetical protein
VIQRITAFFGVVIQRKSAWRFSVEKDLPSQPPVENALSVLRSDSASIEASMLQTL